MSKKLNVEAITNELHGASVFFKPSSQPNEAHLSSNSNPASPPTPNRSQEIVPEQNIRKTQSSEHVTPEHQNTSVTSHRNTVTPGHRNTGMTSHHNTGTPGHHPNNLPDRERKKHGFVVFRDQIDSLEQIVMTQWQRTGKRPEVGDFVREALEHIIAKKKEEFGI